MGPLLCPLGAYPNSRRWTGIGIKLCAAALGLLFSGAPVAGEPRQALRPQRIMSINLCTDLLLLDLVPPGRISSLYYFSRERKHSELPASADHIAVNYGTSEDVVREQPDLVLGGLYTALATRRVIEAAGVPLLAIAPANNFQAIRDITSQVGHAVGEDERARQIIASMDATLARLAATAPAQPIRVVGWDGGDYVPGRDSLFDAIISAAGAVNVGAAPGLRSGRFDLERLLTARPDLIAYGDATVATPSIRGGLLMQPLVQRLYSGRQIVYPDLLYTCGVPESADAAAQVRALMLRALHSRPIP